MGFAPLFENRREEVARLAGRKMSDVPTKAPPKSGRDRERERERESGAGRRIGLCIANSALAIYLPPVLDCSIASAKVRGSRLPFYGDPLGVDHSDVQSLVSASSGYERDIPTSNIDLHYAHCSRNLQKCAICGDMIPKKHADEHYNEIHAPVDCSLCSERIERDLLSLHEGERCLKRIITCEYCEFPLPAVDLINHQEVCGNRTEYCDLCRKYVRLRERVNHDIQFHSSTTDTAEPPRNIPPPGREGANRRPVGASPRKSFLLTIAITGIAVMLGFFFLQKREDKQ
ncbi:hypothetical protein ZIOFF_065036 [Zingiber officinale]|uniref:Uncharacterized protein n=1 Tax=Zingiber officinale TaxID=94328 RepID=A0A8J5EWU2_ZINOF|nr:hypothetical protein ZIOFF_065036 [Zingiber officinale]